MVARTFRVRVSRAGEEFEFEGDKAFVLAMLKRYGSAQPSDQQSSLPPAAPKGEKKKTGSRSGATGKPISIREFIQQLGFKKHTDVTLAFGYYLEHYSDASEFTPADINNCYYDAKIESSNTSQMIIQNIRRGFMMLPKKVAKGRKRYTLTRSGEEYIEEKLKGGS